MKRYRTRSYWPNNHWRRKWYDFTVFTESSSPTHNGSGSQGVPDDPVAVHGTPPKDGRHRAQARQTLLPRVGRHPAGPPARRAQQEGGRGDQVRQEGGFQCQGDSGGAGALKAGLPTS